MMMANTPNSDGIEHPDEQQAQQEGRCAQQALANEIPKCGVDDFHSLSGGACQTAKPALA